MCSAEGGGISNIKFKHSYKKKWHFFLVSMVVVQTCVLGDYKTPRDWTQINMSQEPRVPICPPMRTCILEKPATAKHITKEQQCVK